MRLIDWDKVLEWMHRQKETMEQWSMRIAIENYVDEMPTVDAVSVVRCKDCKYAQKGSFSKTLSCMVWGDKFSPEDYCSTGKRRSENADDPD